MLPHCLKAIVVDDEQPSRQALVNYIEEFCPDVKVIDECNSAGLAYKSILRNNPHIVFLDIEMPKGSGIDLLNKFETISFKIIFVTAFSKYAVKAFRCAATDFLLKPVKVSELQEAVSKAKEEVSLESYHASVEQLICGLNSITNHIYGKLSITEIESEGYKILDFAEIVLCQADTNNTIFFREKERNIIASYHLKHYEDQLPESLFLRVHRSYIVNLRHVKGINNNLIQLTKGLSCPLGITYKDEFKKQFFNGKK
jgi:two-component system LytT family response regulator